MGKNDCSQTIFNCPCRQSIGMLLQNISPIWFFFFLICLVRQSAFLSKRPQKKDHSRTMFTSAQKKKKVGKPIGAQIRGWDAPIMLLTALCWTHSWWSYCWVPPRSPGSWSGSMWQWSSSTVLHIIIWNTTEHNITAMFLLQLYPINIYGRGLQTISKADIQWSLWLKTPQFENSFYFKTSHQWHYS